MIQLCYMCYRMDGIDVRQSYRSFITTRGYTLYGRPLKVDIIGQSSLWYKYYMVKSRLVTVLVQWCLSAKVNKGGNTSIGVS